MPRRCCPNRRRHVIHVGATLCVARRAAPALTHVRRSFLEDSPVVHHIKCLQDLYITPRPRPFATTATRALQWSTISGCLSSPAQPGLCRRRQPVSDAADAGATALGLRRYPVPATRYPLPVSLPATRYPLPAYPLDKAARYVAGQGLVLFQMKWKLRRPSQWLALAACLAASARLASAQAGPNHTEQALRVGREARADPTYGAGAFGRGRPRSRAHGSAIPRRTVPPRRHHAARIRLLGIRALRLRAARDRTAANRARAGRDRGRARARRFARGGRPDVLLGRTWRAAHRDLYRRRYYHPCVELRACRSAATDWRHMAACTTPGSISGSSPCVASCRAKVYGTSRAFRRAFRSSHR